MPEPVALCRISHAVESWVWLQANAHDLPERVVIVHLFTGIDALRQHLRDDVRIQGVITEGGMAPNVVPEFTDRGN